MKMKIGLQSMLLSFAVASSSGFLIAANAEPLRKIEQLKRFSVSTDFLFDALGIFNLGGSYVVSNKLKFNLNAAIATNVHSKSKQTWMIPAGTATVTYFFDRMYSGLFLEPGIFLAQNGRNSDELAYGSQVIAGWGHLWESGLHIQLGLGLGVYYGGFGHILSPYSNHTEKNSFIVLPIPTLRVGYAF